jgi:phage terminase small subunit
MPRRKKDSQGNEILTVREQLFVEGVARGKSLTQAALDAGYSPDSANKIGTENQSKPVIRQAVQQRVQGVTQADTDEVLQLFAAHLRGDVADFQDLFLEDGRLDLQKAKALGISRLIKKLDYEPVSLMAVGSEQGEIFVTRYRCKVEFHDSQSAAKTLADIMGIKQQPRANDADRAHDKEMVEKVKAEVARLVESGWSEADARAIVMEADPRAGQWLY